MVPSEPTVIEAAFGFGCGSRTIFQPLTSGGTDASANVDEGAAVGPLGSDAIICAHTHAPTTG